ncbi:MAG: large conductance mechanosensitive channel protein MscL [Eggerthellaceae bacterium]
MAKGKGFIAEFREFIARGNVMDLAVAVVIGAAFTAIVNSVVSDLIMPLISLFTGGIDFSSMKVTIGEGANAAAFTYGNFINACIQFLIIALVVFLIVKAVNRAKEAAESLTKQVTEEAPTCPFCLEEVKVGATRCPHCAGSFDEPAEATVTVSEATRPSFGHHRDAE